MTYSAGEINTGRDDVAGRNLEAVEGHRLHGTHCEFEFVRSLGSSAVGYDKMNKDIDNVDKLPVLLLRSQFRLQIQSQQRQNVELSRLEIVGDLAGSLLEIFYACSRLHLSRATSKLYPTYIFFFFSFAAR